MFGEYKKTDRGFAVIEFKDSNGRTCCLQQSSAVDDQDGAIDEPGSSFVWLGVHGERRMHLDREQVQGLVERLNQWLEKGDFQ